ncbi:MAG: DivIVA domain-containing protein [Syntrophomonas sp.]|nr:DivIVA domain-containing protein [Syntrophomonas sp.]
MITGMEIRNQQFPKSIRGYNEEEVKSFLQHVAQDYENLYGENSQLRESLQRCKFELDKYHKIEETMNNSLILAQQTAEMLKVNAQKDAERILEDSKRSIAEMLTAYQEIMKHLNLFNLELKSQLNVELELLDKNIKKNEQMAGFFNQPEVRDLVENLGNINLKVTDDAADN